MQVLNDVRREAKLKEFKNHVDALQEIADELNLGDPWSYNRMREILMSIMLNHTVAIVYAGEDAIDESGNEVEYKSTTQDELNATYNGVSNYPTWEKQLKYIRENKIGKYKWHFCARFEGQKIIEIWKLSGDDVLKCIEEKFHRSWINRNNRKDPRLGAVLTGKQIKKYGTKVY
jgi:hypothetical protein